MKQIDVEPQLPPLERRNWLRRMAQNPVAANVLMVLLLAAGLLSLPQIRQEVFPEAELDMVLIYVDYPGASPEEVEQGVILAVEEAVRGLDGVKEVRSTASEGRAVITVELMRGSDGRKALSDVQNALSRITSFPGEVERPLIALATTRGEAISLIVYGDVEEPLLRAIAEQARDELLELPEITTVELGGVRPFEVSVEIREEELRAHALRLEEIANAIRADSIELPSGSIRSENGEILLRVQARSRTAEHIRNIPIRVNRDGSLLRVGDVAKVHEGFREEDIEAFYNGKRAIMVRVYRVGDQRPIEIARRVRQYAEEKASSLPPGVQFAIWGDRSEVFAARIELLRKNAIQGLILVLVALALFLELKLAFWVAMGIPTSVIGSLFFLPAFDVTINMISLFAFILTLGIVVDDAIVVGEAIYHHRQKGKQRLQAAIDGVEEVAVPVVFSVLTTVVAFVPLIFVPGMMGKFFYHIPVVVICVLLISLFESLFILPAHLAHSVESQNIFFSFFKSLQNIFQKCLEWFVLSIYSPAQRFATSFRYLTLSIGIAVLLLALGLVAGGRIGFTFFPKIDADIVTAKIAMPFGVSIDQTKAIERKVLQAGIQALRDLAGSQKVERGIFSMVGSTFSTGGPRPAESVAGSHLAQVAIQLVPMDQRSFSAKQFAEKWRERIGDLPGVDSFQIDYSLAGPSSKAIEFILSHPEPLVLEEAARQMASELARFDGVRDVDDGLEAGKPQINLRLKMSAKALGLSEFELWRQLRSAFFGIEAFRDQKGRNEFKVMVRRSKEERETLATLERFLIRTPTGGEIALSEAATIQIGHAYTKIQRVNGKRIIRISADIKEGANANAITDQAFKNVVPKLQSRFPSLKVDPGGDRQRQDESLAALRYGFILALVAMYAMMAVPFRSYVQPLIIMSAIPFAAAGAVFSHILLGYDLSLMSLMGMVALAGVAVNDSIVYVDATNELRKGGLSPIEAARGAGIRRFRPILLTSITTFFGLAPMIFESSVQARFLIPMAISLGFGVLFCTITTLFIVPALYLAIEDLRDASSSILNWLFTRRAYEESTQKP
ncbi:MAG: efflux RND transporter permease subunit [Sandaracinaceae bacterium]|nr:efflux RND transporter permease subunit [Sandaracinaceae bacterium]